MRSTERRARHRGYLSARTGHGANDLHEYGKVLWAMMFLGLWPAAAAHPAAGGPPAEAPAWIAAT
ncbi:MAG: hypothetical protein ACRER7_08590, partial [Gammaproteobacteria bacterium]